MGLRRAVPGALDRGFGFLGYGLDVPRFRLRRHGFDFRLLGPGFRRRFHLRGWNIKIRRLGFERRGQPRRNTVEHFCLILEKGKGLGGIIGAFTPGNGIQPVVQTVTAIFQRPDGRLRRGQFPAGNPFQH